jgi:hypothetical protein
MQLILTVLPLQLHARHVDTGWAFPTAAFARDTEGHCFGHIRAIEPVVT